MSKRRDEADRLFIGVYPCGLSYADRSREVGGDWLRLAFLSFRTLELKWSADVPVELRAAILSDAATVQARRGQPYQVSTSGQTVMLGEEGSDE